MDKCDVVNELRCDTDQDSIRIYFYSYSCHSDEIDDIGAAYCTLFEHYLKNKALVVMSISYSYRTASQYA